MTFISSFDDGSIVLDASLAASHVSEAQIEEALPEVNAAIDILNSKTGLGNAYLGWMDLMSLNHDEELYRIVRVASSLREKTDFLLTIGIGGSYLGARACYEALKKPASPYALRYAGTSFSSYQFAELIDSLGDADFAVNVISKSGTTTETAIAFRIIYDFMVRKFGKEKVGERIIVTTDKSKGILRELADSRGWESFVIPDSVGGRFSVLTPAGLFPLAYAGIDIDALVGGATECAVACQDEHLARNPLVLFAAVRNILQKSGIRIELLASFEPRMEQFIEWWKQLFGESLGKNNQGMFPAGAIFSRDLHSIGQWIQEGSRNIYEIFLDVKSSEPSIRIPSIEGEDENFKDGLEYLSGRELTDINRIVIEATRTAHAQGRCPNILLQIPYMDEYHLGTLIYFFEYACGVCGYMAGINPFNQPGVEVYKKNMFSLLKKPE